ncbi:MAG: response regulator, partial [Deltaproteobacteria bacterium]|nr:response regulator [Deltaproteobacteria bacterium]
LMKDEEEHARLMARALSVYKDIPALTVPFEIDDGLKDRHKAIIKRILDMIDDGTFTAYAMLDSAIELEHAELSSLFIYVTESLKEYSEEFVDFSVEVEKHKRSIERFLRSRCEFELLVKKIPKIPSVWNEKILIVDKSEPFVNLMKVVLTKEGLVNGTDNGKDALKRIREEYFDLIMMDINLIGIDGMKLYREAVKIDTTIKDRILFLSSNRSKEYIEFFEDEEVKYLVKPASIKDIVVNSIDILEKRNYS